MEDDDNYYLDTQQYIEILYDESETTPKKMTSQRRVEYTHNTNGEILDIDEFSKNDLSIESHEPGFVSGHSISFIILDDELLWSEWIWVDTPDEFDGEEFGWCLT